MKIIRFLSITGLSCIALAAAVGLSFPHPAVSGKSLEQLSREALSPDPAISTPAVVALRAAGPDGLQTLLRANADLLQGHRTSPEIVARQDTDGTWTRLKAVLDEVGRQRDCYASGLYWFTDFERAQAAARVSGKPILSLRLLGNLDEELSCANSRFFRTTLYANAEVSAYLRERFVLHWKSVRPVPRFTIDFGDGRTIERTVTGNSIHYVLASNGEVVDALPGLYGAKAFVEGLQRAEQVALGLATVIGHERENRLRQYHRSRIHALNVALEADLQKISASPIVGGIDRSVQAAPSSPPTAHEAARVAVGKRAVERPILSVSMPGPARTTGNAAQMDDETWERIAALHGEHARLDAASMALIRAKNPSAADAGRRALTKSMVEDPLIRQIRNLERSISEDTVRNEYLLHLRIHEWLAQGSSLALEDLNKRVYAELFLTPDSDPWLGLLPPDTFAALENGGIREGIGVALK